MSLQGAGARILAFLAALLLGAAWLPAPAGARENPDAAQVQLADLPPEARETVARIRRGGPFPYPRDGIVFQNREKRLPAAARGTYREYTVKTPGVAGRGARRIVAAGDGRLYYTEDHYRSFRRIRE
jgi:ribonuclease T1